MHPVARSNSKILNKKTLKPSFQKKPKINGHANGLDDSHKPEFPKLYKDLPIPT